MITSKLLLCITVVISAFVLVLFSALRISQPELFVTNFRNVAFAQETGQPTDLVATDSAQRDTDAVDYYLPYPGILPDHPLYWVKMIRDRVKLFFTTDPHVQLDLLLLYADKRLGAGEVLVTGGQDQLGVSTITKAEKYLIRAHDTLKIIAETEDIDPVVYQQFAKAFLKHQEVMTPLFDQVEDQYKESLQKAFQVNRERYDASLVGYLEPPKEAFLEAN